MNSHKLPYTHLLVMVLIAGIGAIAWNYNFPSDGNQAQALPTTQPNSVPNAPTLAQAFNYSDPAKGKPAVIIAWKDNSSNESSFWVMKSLTGNGTDWEVLKKLSPNSTSVIDDTVKLNTKYYYRIRANSVSSDPNHSWSNIVSIVAAKADVASPQMVEAYDSTLTKPEITVRWRPGDTRAMYYEIQRVESGNQTRNWISPSMSTFFDTEVKPNTQYTYFVRAVVKIPSIPGTYYPQMSSYSSSNAVNLGDIYTGQNRVTINSTSASSSVKLGSPIILYGSKFDPTNNTIYYNFGGRRFRLLVNQPSTNDGSKIGPLKLPTSLLPGYGSQDVLGIQVENKNGRSNLFPVNLLK